MFSDKREFMQWMYDGFYEDMISSGARFVYMDHPNREDIIHGAILSTFQLAHDRYQEDALHSHPNIKGWVYKVFYNRLRDEIKKSARYYRRTKLHPNDSLTHMEQTDIVDQWLTNEVFVQVLDEIKEIRKNPVDEAVFQAYFVEDMSVKEIAAKCGLTESAVKSIVYRMRRRAKKKKATLLTFLFALAMGLNQLFL